MSQQRVNARLDTRLKRLERTALRARQDQDGEWHLAWRGARLPVGGAGAETDPIASAAIAAHEAEDRTDNVHGLDTALDTIEASIASLTSTVTNLLGAADAMVLKGPIDCSANPNYPAADRGHVYKVSVAGKIGGGSGPAVEVGDAIICITDGSAAGTHASVGANWFILETNHDGVVTGPASATADDLASYNGVSGKVIKDSGAKAANVPTDGQKAALAGTEGTPGSGNLYVTEDGLLDNLFGASQIAMPANVAIQLNELPAHSVSANGQRLTASANGELVVDGIAVSDLDPLPEVDPFVFLFVLVLNDSAGGDVKAGVYMVAEAGSVSTPWVLHRRADPDEWSGDYGPDGGIWVADVTAGSVIRIREGSRAGDVFMLDLTLSPADLGTTLFSYRQLVNATPPASTAVRLATAAALPTASSGNNILTATANGALTVDGVSVAANDRILVKDFGGGSTHLNGIWQVVRPGDGSTTWRLRRTSDFRVSKQMVPGLVVNVAEGTRNADRQFKLTTDGAITLNTTGLTFAVTAPKDWGLVTSLTTPTAGAIVGDRCTYQADGTNGILWDLFYDGNGSYPWKKLGGPPLFAEVATSETLASTGSYQALATAGPSITPPVDGDYYERQGFEGLNSTGAGANNSMSFDIGGTAASDTDRILNTYGTASQDRGSGTRPRRKNGLTAGNALVSKYKTTNATATFASRWFELDPIRVA